MKKQKIEKEFTYEGLGFPIILYNVPMIQLRNNWVLDLDLNMLQKIVLLTLAHHPYEITGNQVRFVRNFFNLTQKKFGQLFGVSHPAIVKWEKCENQSTKMSLTTQRDLRLWVLDQLLSKDEDFRKGFKLIHTNEYSSQVKHIELNVPTDLVAV